MKPPNHKTNLKVSSEHLWPFQGAFFSGALSPCNSENPAEVQALPLKDQPEISRYSTASFQQAGRVQQYHAALAGLTDHKSRIAVCASDTGT